MARHLNTLVSGILSGVLIAIGGTAFLLTKQYSVVVASFMFSIGLFAIIALKLNLYTGKIGYAFANKKSYILDLLIIYLGNAIGVFMCGLFAYLAKLPFSEIANEVCATKLSDVSYLGLAVKSVGCGILIFLAVELQKRDLDAIWKLFGIVVCIMAFILSGFEHCIADMFYLFAAGCYSAKAVVFIAVVTLGNSIGSIIFRQALDLLSKTSKSNIV